MTEKGSKYLSDVILAITLIQEFTRETLDFYTYASDKKTQSAVERQLVIIGEALNQFRKIEPQQEIKHDKQIINFRNRLVHAYDSIDNSIVWAILNNHLEPLRAEISALFNESSIN